MFADAPGDSPQTAGVLAGLLLHLASDTQAGSGSRMTGFIVTSKCASYT